MTKQVYLDQLRKYLKKLPAEDYADAMEYFTEYFEEADEEQAQQLMHELGTPKEAARELIQNLLDKKITEQADGTAPKKKSHIFWIAFLTICAAPIGVPLLIALLLVLCALCICAAAIVLSVFCCALAFFLVGGKLIVRGLLAIPYSLSGCCLIAGSGLLTVGIGILAVVLGVYLCKWCQMLFAKLARWISQKRRR